MKNIKQKWFEETEIVYAEVLQHCTNSLNAIHQVCFSKRFWDIFIGAWLREFVELVILQIYVCESGLIRKIETNEPTRIKSLVEYRKLSKNSQFIEALRFEVKKELGNPISQQSFTPIDQKSRIENSQKIKLGRVYLSATYLSRRIEVAMQIIFLRFPKRLTIIDPPEEAVDVSLRTAIAIFRKASSRNSRIVISLLPRYLPIVYLESFNSMLRTRRPWRSNRFPRVIFTANRHLYDDVFNFWTAHAVENGSKLMIAQHGGYYGISEYPSNFERHEFDIADRYISWGWNSSENSIAGPALILVNQRFIKRIDPHLVIVVTDQLFTYPRSILGDIDESSSYLQNIQTFVRNLEQISGNVLIRIPITHDDSGHSQIKWFNDHLPQTTIDYGQQKFRELLKQAKIVVMPHNGTTLLESIALGVPTIIMWDKSIVWMRSEAEVVFNALEQVGIFHRTPESASSFINSIWDDVDGWWNSQATIDARKQFTDQYARSVPNPIRFLAKALQF